MKNHQKILIIINLLFLFSCIVPVAGVKEASKLRFEDKSKVKETGGIFNKQSKERSIKAFQATVYPLLRSKTCVACHGEARKVRPYYLLDDVEKSWNTLVNISRKVDLDIPSSSRIYLRLKKDSHHCFDRNCEKSAALVLAAIEKWVEFSGAGQDDQSSGKITKQLGFADIEKASPELSYGTILFEAEQKNQPQAMTGRFHIELDGKASDSRYARTFPPKANPVTQATRTASFNKTNACELISQARLSDSKMGPFRIREQATHINTGIRSQGGNLVIKDGYRPYSNTIRAKLIRPDKRMEYAKRLSGWSNGRASGVSDFLTINDFILKDEGFNFADVEVRYSKRETGRIDISSLVLDGNDKDYKVFQALPYFTKREQVFSSPNSSDYITYQSNPNAKVQNLEGNNIDLHLLFANPQRVIPTKTILNYLEVNKISTNAYNYRKNILFKVIYEQLKAVISGNLPYSKIQGMDENHMFSLYGNMKLSLKACPSGICNRGTQIIEVTSGTDNGGVRLSYQNQLDILKVNGSGSAFVAGSNAELSSGIAFRRIDIYSHLYKAPNTNLNSDSFIHDFYNFNGTSFTLSKRVIFPLHNTDSNLNLRAVYTKGVDSLSKEDNLGNFQKTLYPILKRSACIGCHSTNPNRPQFTNSNPVAAFNALTARGLINFGNPENSFRKMNAPTSAYMIHNCNGASNARNAALCPNIETDFITGIRAWSTANNISKANNSSSPYTEFSEKQRTPGSLMYKFKVTETGHYNIWTKIKSGNGSASSISLKVLNNDTAIKPFNGIKNPSGLRSSCYNYDMGNKDTWTWFTPGRQTELANLNSLGKKKLDNRGKERIISDSRLYWPLEAGKTYTLHIFENEVNTKIDLIAIDRVKNHEDVLDFQPDLRARDENNISDYEMRTLSYDISNLVDLPPKSAYFNVEVKKALGEQNYIFRNPRIDSPRHNIRVRDIKVFINKTKMFSDSTWTTLNLSTGNNSILTFAPLVTLVQGNSRLDRFHFVFGTLEKTKDVLTEYEPRGSAPIIVDGLKCKELDLFNNTVKPILRNARLILKGDNGLKDYTDDFPSGIRNRGTIKPVLYQCMTCHNDAHPYFKMTTFDYPEILCSQALGRVDFENYRDSLIVRGIDGSGAHPKLFFIEQLQYTNDKKSVVEYNANDGRRILDGQILNSAEDDDAEYFSKWYPDGYFATYSASDLGVNNNWNSNNSTKKDMARTFLGQLKRVEYYRVPDLTTMPFYEPLVHDEFIGKIRFEEDDFTSGTFPRRGVNMYKSFIPRSINDDLSKKSYEVKFKKQGAKLLRDGNNKKIFNTIYNEEQMSDQLELIKDEYRQIIMNWIRAEDLARRK